MKEDVKVNLNETVDSTEVKESVNPDVQSEVETKTEAMFDETPNEVPVAEEPKSLKDMVDPTEANMSFKELVAARKSVTKKIILVTTEGCEACNKMKALLGNLEPWLKSKRIEVISVDKGSITEVLNTTVKLEDFPTILFVKNEEVVYQEKGTMSMFALFAKMKKYIF